MKSNCKLKWQQVRQWLVNFDIKPAKPIISELLQKVALATDQGDYKNAEKLLYKILALNSTNLAALHTLGNLKHMQGNLHSSLRLLRHALKHHPDNYELCEDLGIVCWRLRKFRAAAKSFNTALILRPDSTHIKHVLDSLQKNNTDGAPQGYIIDLFDGYASYYEVSLLQKLLYQAHIQLTNYLCKWISSAEPITMALDLGCGTGLLGQELAKNFKISNLIGVDLSPKMLEKSRSKDIYHSLCESDLIDYLRQTTSGVDLIVSSDVLIYIGDLSSVFAESYRCLKPGGYFGFSVESQTLGSYNLTTSGRYKHSLRYIKSLYKKYCFSRMYSQTIDLRMEYGNMVKGYLVLLQK